MKYNNKTIVDPSTLITDVNSDYVMPIIPTKETSSGITTVDTKQEDAEDATAVEGNFTHEQTIMNARHAEYIKQHPTTKRKSARIKENASSILGTAIVKLL